MKALLISLYLISFSVNASILKDDHSRKLLKEKIKPVPSGNQLQKVASVQYDTKLSLLEKYKRNYDQRGRDLLKKDTLNEKFDAVPTLIRVMKENSFPDENKWVATFMLGRIMGVKSVPFITKFTTHPNWMLRLASLKTLLSLGQKDLESVYVQALKDPSSIVRYQALDNIRRLKLNHLAPQVWEMLLDKSNYVESNGKLKRSHIIREAILTIGYLKFEKAKKPMLSMIKDKKYKDIFKELDYSLQQITQKESPKGNYNKKLSFWASLDSQKKNIR